jgi:hypothetical protein
MKLQVLPYVTVEVDDRLRRRCAVRRTAADQCQGISAERRRRCRRGR